MGLLSAIGGIWKAGTSAVGNLLNKGSGTYQSPIISVPGQKERLSNVVNTFKSVLTGGGLSVNNQVIKNTTVAKAVEKVASHPFISAGVVAGGIVGTKKLISAVKLSQPKPSGILTSSKSTQNTQQSYESSPPTNPSITTDILDKKDNPNINAVAQGTSVTEFLGGESNVGRSGNRAISAKPKRKRRKKKRKATKRRSFKRNKAKKRSRVTKRKGKVRYTKKGQPYIILRNGRARFIKGKRKKKR